MGHPGLPTPDGARQKKWRPAAGGGRHAARRGSFFSVGWLFFRFVGWEAEPLAYIQSIEGSKCKNKFGRVDDARRTTPVPI
jgi:hypothetical protein